MAIHCSETTQGNTAYVAEGECNNVTLLPFLGFYWDILRLPRLPSNSA